MKTKFILFLATEKGYTSLQYLLHNNLIENIACVVSFKEIDVKKEWYTDIVKLCQDADIPFRDWFDVRTDLTKLLIDTRADSAIAISWKYLLPLSINDILRTKLIVFHDSMLPKYRGFAPTPTAVINGDEFIGITALFAGESADNGDILLQRKMQIEPNEYIKEIIKRQADIYAEMTLELIDKISKNRLTAQSQDNSEATYSIWRDLEDYKIDWQWTAKKIFNTIRALGEPYQGAFTLIDDEKIIISEAEVVEDLTFEIRQPGKIWSITDGMPVVVCGSGLLKIIKAYDSNNNIYSFKKLRTRLI